MIQPPPPPPDPPRYASLVRGRTTPAGYKLHTKRGHAINACRASNYSYRTFSGGTAWEWDGTEWVVLEHHNPGDPK